jgi:hypothetical protein
MLTKKFMFTASYILSRLDGEKIYDVVSIRTMDLITEKYMVDLNKIECTCIEDGC